MHHKQETNIGVCYIISMKLLKHNLWGRCEGVYVCGVQVKASY